MAPAFQKRGYGDSRWCHSAKDCGYEKADWGTARHSRKKRKKEKGELWEESRVVLVLQEIMTGPAYWDLGPVSGGVREQRGVMWVSLSHGLGLNVVGSDRRGVSL